MKITLRLDDSSIRPVHVPHDGADHAIADGACPSCKASPFRVQGSGNHVAADDRAYEAHGQCLTCSAWVGTIRAEVSTIFGIREDQAVLQGRPRVY